MSVNVLFCFCFWTLGGHAPPSSCVHADSSWQEAPLAPLGRTIAATWYCCGSGGLRRRVEPSPVAVRRRREGRRELRGILYHATCSLLPRSPTRPLFSPRGQLP